MNLITFWKNKLVIFHSWREKTVWILKIFITVYNGCLNLEKVQGKFWNNTTPKLVSSSFEKPKLHCILKKKMWSGKIRWFKIAIFGPKLKLRSSLCFETNESLRWIIQVSWRFFFKIYTFSTTCAFSTQWWLQLITKISFKSPCTLLILDHTCYV